MDQMTNMNHIISKKLIELRAGRDRAEVAKALGISKSALQMYENGKRIPRDPIKIKIADFYGVTVQYLFFDQSNHKMCTKSA